MKQIDDCYVTVITVEQLVRFGQRGMSKAVFSFRVTYIRSQKEPLSISDYMYCIVICIKGYWHVYTTS